jgi:hypothetical protein
MYTGPWKEIPGGERKSKNKDRDPLKPKRPMSTFLAYSTARRESVRKHHPELKNSEISVILGQMWTKASQSERQVYVDEEQKLRTAYKASIAKWRTKVAKDDADKRQTRESRALQMALAQQNGETGDMVALDHDGTQYPFSDGIDTRTQSVRTQLVETQLVQTQSVRTQSVRTQSGFPAGMTPSYHPTYAYPQANPIFSTGLSLPTGEGYMNPNEQGRNICMPSHYDNSMVQQGEFDIAYNLLVRLRFLINMCPLQLSSAHFLE